jgi:hypothetical protein
MINTIQSATVGSTRYIGRTGIKKANTASVCDQAKLFSGRFRAKPVHWTYMPEQNMKDGLRRASERYRSKLVRDLATGPAHALRREVATQLFNRVGRDTGKLFKLGCGSLGIPFPRLNRALRVNGWLLPAMIVAARLERM